MAERIITADEARALREAATPGPWRVTDADSVAPRVGGAWPVAYVPGDDDDRPWDVDGDAPVEPTPLADADLIAAAPDLAASVEHYVARAERLARILAVERGDASRAPEGWAANYAGDMWTRTVSGRSVWIHRFAPNGVSMWEMRGIRRDDPAHREWPTALEAMEAIDAGVTHAG